MDFQIWAAKFFGSAFGVLLSMLFVAPTNTRNALYRILFALALIWRCRCFVDRKLAAN